MSSTTTPAAAAGVGADGLGHDCLVCGKPSTTRCSSCFAKSGFSLYFCSTEHQKLAWPFHKLVCGERAHPFRLPPFTQKEADVAYKRIFEPVDDEKNRELQERMRSGLRALLSQPEKLQSLLNKIVGHEGELALAPTKPGSGDFSQELDNLVTGLRCYGSQWRPSERTYGDVSLPEMFLRFYLGIRLHFRLDQHSEWHSWLCHSIGVQATVHLAFNADKQKTARDLRLAVTLSQADVDNHTHRLRFFETAALPSASDGFRANAIKLNRRSLEVATYVRDFTGGFLQKEEQAQQQTPS